MPSVASRVLLALVRCCFPSVADDDCLLEGAWFWLFWLLLLMAVVVVFADSSTLSSLSSPDRLFKRTTAFSPLDSRSSRNFLHLSFRSIKDFHLLNSAVETLDFSWIFFGSTRCWVW